MATSPYSPDVLAWLMGQGPMPFGEAPVPLYPGSFGTEDELSILNDILTAQKKGNDVMSDPAQIAQYGTGAGGFSPESFQPSVTFEPVKAPGYMQMQRYLQSTDPVMSYMAKRLDQGATAVQVETEIRNLVKGGGPEGQKMLAALPMRDDDLNAQPIDVGGVTITPPSAVDWNRVGAIASGLEKAIIEDPQFNAIDEQTGLPANRVEQESEAARYFREAGLPNPYETYSPDLLADSKTLDRERQVQNVGIPRAYSAAQEANARYAMLADLLKGARSKTYGDATTTGEDGLPRVAGEINLDELPSSALSVATTGSEAGSASNQRNAGRNFGQDNLIYEPSTPATTGRRTPSQAKVQRRSALQSQLRQASQQQYETRKERTRMNNANQDDIYNQLERQALMSALTKAGYTPFNEVMRARQQTIYGR